MQGTEPKWLDWARRLQAIAQTGLAYTDGVYDRERYRTIEDIDAEIISAQTGAGIEAVHALWEHEFGYATPKVDVRGVIFRGDTILLVREREDGLWTLPGGWADIQTSPAENVIKEIQEESGFLTRAVKLLAVYDRSLHAHTPLFPYHVYKLFFQCEIIGGEANASLETSEVAFFGEDELPQISISRVLPSQINRFFEHRRNADWPTDFD